MARLSAARRALRPVRVAARALGVDGTSVRGVARFPAYFSRRAAFARQAAASNGEFALGTAYPCLWDHDAQGGVATGQYFHQDLYVAQRIFANAPRRHVDVASRVDGFVAHVAAFREIEVFDIRPIMSDVPGIVFHQSNVMQPSADLAAITDSLSCLHALEHFGLGRYGDPIDYYGYRRAWDNLHSMLLPGGTLYFSVPIGSQQRVEYDAHRIFSIPYVQDTLIANRYEIVGFAYVDDSGDMHREVDSTSDAAQRTFDLRHGCGIWELRATG
jgi:hypothetical protein